MRQDALEITLREFLALAEIPRPSHHEEKVGAYLVEWAKKHGLCVTQDEIGDVIIDKVASPGCENADRVIIQAHMEKYLAVIAQNSEKGIYLDGSTLVGKLAPGMNRQLGILAAQEVYR